MEDEWSRLRLLITGASGLYGSKLAHLAQTKGHQVFSVYNQHKAAYGKPVQLEVSDREQVEKTFIELSPEVVVHAASLTDVDRCELNRNMAWKTNVEGTKNIVAAANAANASLMHISTDYVFNGETGQYKETDSPNPINYYGVTKLKAEEEVKSTANTYCIVRPSVIYGATPAAGKVNFALWLLNNIKKGEKVKALVDQWNSPTLNTSLALMTLEIVERKLTGIFHLSGATRISRYDFARQVAQKFNADSSLIVPTLAKDFLWVAPRPRDSSLDTSKAQRILKNKPLTIEYALQEMRQELDTLANR